LVVAGQNFADDPNVLVMILVAGLIGLVVLMLVGGEMGRRSQAAAEE
jgi:BASS family bile acid:Na+ symporter